MTEGAGRAALRNAGLLLVQRAGLVVAGLGFAAVIPRLLGPEVYGRYALVAALAVVFAACSTLGVNEIVGRHGALLAAEANPEGLRRLFGSLLALRVASGLLAAAAFGGLTVLWLRDLDHVALLAAALTSWRAGSGSPSSRCS